MKRKAVRSGFSGILLFALISFSLILLQNTLLSFFGWAVHLPNLALIILFLEVFFKKSDWLTSFCKAGLAGFLLAMFSSRSWFVLLIVLFAEVVVFKYLVDLVRSRSLFFFLVFSLPLFVLYHLTPLFIESVFEKSGTSLLAGVDLVRMAATIPASLLFFVFYAQLSKPKRA